MADGLTDLPIAMRCLPQRQSSGLDLGAALAGDDEHLRPTEIAQPALLLVECALRSTLPDGPRRRRGGRPQRRRVRGGGCGACAATRRCDATRHRARQRDGGDARGHDVRAASASTSTPRPRCATRRSAKPARSWSSPITTRPGSWSSAARRAGVDAAAKRRADARRAARHPAERQRRVPLAVDGRRGVAVRAPRSTA